MPLMTWDGWLEDFEPWRATFDNARDLFGFPFAEIDDIEGYWFKESERNFLKFEQIEAMVAALQPLQEGKFLCK